LSRIFISGAQGFIGQHLTAALLEKGHQVDGPTFELESETSIRSVLGTQVYDVAIHLAGISHVADCEKDPVHARDINVEGSKRLFQALNKTSPLCHFIFASTAQVYQAPQAHELDREIEFTEDRAIQPQNLYAQTKWEVEEFLQGESSHLAHPVTVLRFFNHTHKSQSPRFFLPHVYRQLMECRGQSGTAKIPVGDLTLKRDLGSVRDLVQALMAVIEKRNWKFEIFNVCSGQAKELGVLAEELRKRLDVPAEFIKDPSRLRPGEPRVLKGSHAKLTKATGWEPRVRGEADLIDDFLCD